MTTTTSPRPLRREDQRERARERQRPRRDGQRLRRAPPRRRAAQSQTRRRRRAARDRYFWRAGHGGRAQVYRRPAGADAAAPAAFLAAGVTAPAPAPAPAAARAPARRRAPLRRPLRRRRRRLPRPRAPRLAPRRAPRPPRRPAPDADARGAVEPTHGRDARVDAGLVAAATPAWSPPPTSLQFSPPPSAPVGFSKPAPKGDLMDAAAWDDEDDLADILNS